MLDLILNSCALSIVKDCGMRLNQVLVYLGFEFPQKQAFEQAVGNIPSPSPVHISKSLQSIEVILMLLTAIPLKQFGRVFNYGS
ncbi:unnamed protein product [Lathyrus sativus]|nr:unnamed protein product [Lathyrus sativus]